MGAAPRRQPGHRRSVECPANDRLQLRKTPALPERPAILHRAEQRIVEALHGVAAAPRCASQVRTWLTNGGRRIRTSGPALARGSVGVIEGRCRTDRPAWRSLSSGALARRRWSGAGALPTAVPLTAGPKVRIQLPPAASLRTFVPRARCVRPVRRQIKLGLWRH